MQSGGGAGLFNALEHDRNYLGRWGFRRGLKSDSSCWLGWRPAANAKALLV